MTDRKTRVSLVVPLYNSSVYTRVFLLALREILPGEPGVEVVLVDNGSTDDTASVLAELGPPHRVLSLPDEGVSLRVRLETPASPGSCLLEWDIVIEGVAWFSERGVPTATHRVEVHAEIPADPPGAGRME